MADGLTYGQQQAEANLQRWQGLSGKMRKPSYMASPEEKAAYAAQEVRAGSAPAYELPEDYGGMPQGMTRRAFRAQVAWDAAQTARLQQEQAMRQQAEYDRKLEIEGREELVNQARRESQIQEYRAAQKIAGETETQRVNFDSGFAELDPRTPEFLDQFAALRKDNPLALLVPEVKGLVDDYMKINEIYRSEGEASAAEMEAKQKEEKTRQENKIVKLASLTKLAKGVGINLSDLVQSDKDTGELIIDPIAVGEAEAKLATKPPVDPNLPVYRREASKLREQVRQLDSKILANQVDARGAKTERAKEEFEQNIRVLTAQRDNLYAEYIGIEDLLQESGGTVSTPPAQDVSEGQIDAAKRIAENPNHPRNAAAIEFLRTNNVPFEPPQSGGRPAQPPQAPAPTATPAATTGVNLAPPTAPQPIQAPTGPTTRQSSAQEQLAEIDRILASNASPTEKAVAASRRADLQNIVRGEEAGAQTRQQAAQAQTSEQLVSWRNNIVNTVTDKDWMGTVQGPKSGVDPNDYFLTIKDAFDRAPATDPREYVGLLSLIVGRRGPTGIVMKKNIDPELKESVISEIRRVIEESDAGDNWQGRSRKPNFNWQRIVPAEALKKSK